MALRTNWPWVDGTEVLFYLEASFKERKIDSFFKLFNDSSQKLVASPPFTEPSY